MKLTWCKCSFTPRTPEIWGKLKMDSTTGLVSLTKVAANTGEENTDRTSLNGFFLVVEASPVSYYSEILLPTIPQSEKSEKITKPEKKHGSNFVITQTKLANYNSCAYADRIRKINMQVKGVPHFSH